MSRASNMQSHLISQFTDKKVLTTVIEALGEEMDEIMQTFSDLQEKRWIDTGEGVQLDGIGEIVCQSRQIDNAVQIPFFGFEGQPNTLTFGEGRFRDAWETWLQSVNLSDPEYRMMLWQKVAKNTSLGTAEDTISSLKFIFNAPKVVLSNIGNAKISVAIGRKLNANDIAMAKAVDLMVRAGGVGIDKQEHFDYNNYFGFLGQLNAKGFDVGEFADLF